MCDHSNGLTQHDDDNGVTVHECSRCGYCFVGLDDYQKATASSDMAAAVASAMLWDFHERAIEKYGAEVAATVAPDSTVRPGQHFVDDGHEHDWDLGKCVLCGTTIFVGDD